MVREFCALFLAIMLLAHDVSGEMVQLEDSSFSAIKSQFSVITENFEAVVVDVEAGNTIHMVTNPLNQAIGDALSTKPDQPSPANVQLLFDAVVAEQDGARAVIETAGVDVKILKDDLEDFRKAVATSDLNNGDLLDKIAKLAADFDALDAIIARANRLYADQVATFNAVKEAFDGGDADGLERILPEFVNGIALASSIVGDTKVVIAAGKAHLADVDEFLTNLF